jgi:hypothetical protein
VTRAQEIHAQVTTLLDAGWTEAQIASEVGISVERVAQIVERADTGARRATEMARTSNREDIAGEPRTRTASSRKAAPKIVRQPAPKVVKPKTPAKPKPVKVPVVKQPRPVKEPVVKVPVPRKPRALKPIEHGTAPGYQAHVRRGEEPCEPCKAAHRADNATYRLAKGLTKHVGPRPINHGTYAGFRQEARRGVSICDACREARNTEARRQYAENKQRVQEAS